MGWLCFADVFLYLLLYRAPQRFRGGKVTSFFKLMHNTVNNKAAKHNNIHATLHYVTSH